MKEFEKILSTFEKTGDGNFKFYYIRRCDGARVHAKKVNYKKTEKGWFNINSPAYTQYILEQNENIDN